jgi:hypothetical protein
MELNNTQEEIRKRTVGTLNESSLHSALKLWYAEPGDGFEIEVDGYVVDIVRKSLLIEIQTGNFTALKKKLRKLIEHNSIRVVYPIAVEKWLVYEPYGNVEKEKKRKSPKRGRIEDLFVELVRLPLILVDENFSLEVLFIHEEEVRRYDGKRGWRRKGWVIADRRLLKVVGSSFFEYPRQLSLLLPDDLPEQFTTLDLAMKLDLPRWKAQKMVYCLKKLNQIIPIDKNRRSIVYQRT